MFRFISNGGDVSVLGLEEAEKMVKNINENPFYVLFNKQEIGTITKAEIKDGKIMISGVIEDFVYEDFQKKGIIFGDNDAKS